MNVTGVGSAGSGTSADVRHFAGSAVDSMPARVNVVMCVVRGIGVHVHTSYHHQSLSSSVAVLERKILYQSRSLSSLPGSRSRRLRWIRSWKKAVRSMSRLLQLLRCCRRNRPTPNYPAVQMKLRSAATIAESNTRQTRATRNATVDFAIESGRANHRMDGVEAAGIATVLAIAQTPSKMQGSKRRERWLTRNPSRSHLPAVSSLALNRRRRPASPRAKDHEVILSTSIRGDGGRQDGENLR